MNRECLRVLMVGNLLLAWAPVSAAPRLFGGVEADETAWAAVAAVYSAESDPSKGYFASAVLIHPRFLLTAAHVVAGKRPDELSCLLGEHLLSSADAVPLSVVDIILHPEFEDTKTMRIADLALLRLSAPVMDVTPVPLAEGQDPNEALETETLTVGWAGDAKVARRQDFRQQLALPISSRDTANLKPSYGGRLDERMLVIGMEAMKEDACLETESAPVFIASDDGYRVLGVTSFGEGCRQKNKYHVVTNAYHFRSWVMGILWPDYAGWEASRQTSGFFEDHDRDGVANLEQYVGEAGPSTEAVAKAWGTARPAEFQFAGGLGDREPVIQASSDLSQWTDLTDAQMDIEEAAGMISWKVHSPAPGAQAQFVRLRAGLSARYTRVPKPIVFGTSLEGEIMSVDDQLGDGNLREREYLVLGNEGVDQVRIRVGGDELPATLTVIDAVSGEVLAMKAPEPGMPSSLVVAGGRDLIARVSTMQTASEARYGFLVSAPSTGRVTPENFVRQAQVGTETEAMPVRVTNTGDGILDYVVSTDTPWLRVAEPSGAVEPKKSATIQLTVDTNILQTLGANLGTITVTLLDSEILTIPVTVSLRPAGTVLRVGSQVLGQLDAGDLRSSFLDFDGQELPMDLYVFEAPSAGRYLISMGSGIVDSYLYMFNGLTGEYITEADDNGLGAIYNAGIIRRFEAGEIVSIEATSYGRFGVLGIVGPYQINAVRLGD